MYNRVKLSHEYMFNKFTDKEKSDAIKAAFFLIPLGIIIVWTILSPNPNRRSDSQINQDAECRKLRQKSGEAKTQDELDFANRNFLASCANWNPPNY